MSAEGEVTRVPSRRVVAVAIAPLVFALCTGFLGWLADQLQWWALAGVGLALVALTFVAGSRAVTSRSPGLARAYFLVAGVGSGLVAVAAAAGVVVFAVAAALSSGSEGFGDLARLLGVMLAVLCLLVAAGAAYGAVGAFRISSAMGRAGAANPAVSGGGGA